MGGVAGKQTERMTKQALKNVRQAAAKVAKAEVELDEMMLQARETGESLRDIGAEAGLSHQQVSNRLKKHERGPE
jgi:hypothetical protein